MSTPTDLGARLRSIERGAWIAGLAGLAASVVAAFVQPASFFPGYLYAYLFWSGLSLGALAVLMVHYQVGGSWGYMTRRILESATRVLPVLVVLFVPILFGLGRLYPWARPEEVRADRVLQHQAPYLNVGFFLVRSGIYFVTWLACAYFLNRWSTLEDRSGNPDLWTRRRRLSGAGLVLYALTTYFASVDWVMSTEPHSSSTICGLIVIASQALGAFALATAMTVFLSGDRALHGLATRQRLNDLGNLLLTAVMLWAYVSFSQYLILWSENLPREIPWVVSRTTTGWKALALGLVVLHFAVPFVLLLFRGVKTRGPWIAAVALGLLAMRLVDDFWRVIPAFKPGGFDIDWPYLVTPIGIGGVWIAVFLGALRRRPLVPPKDPTFHAVLEEALAHE